MELSASAVRWPRSETGQAMVSLMVSLVIILLLVLVTLGMMKGSLGTGQSTPAMIEGKARGIQCQSYLAQYRAMPLVNDPEKMTIDSLDDFGKPGELRCPVSGVRFRLDPTRSDDPLQWLYCPYPKHRAN